MNSNFYIQRIRAKLKRAILPEELNTYTCLYLSEKIFCKTNQVVSASTLQRLMGFVPSKSSISNSTLNILSVYLDFESWDDFKFKHESGNNTKNNPILPDEGGLKLFEIACKNHHFKSVLDYIEILPVGSYTSQRYRIGEILGNSVRHDRKAQKVLLPELAKSAQGRFYFYENFVDLDYLSHYFAANLDVYQKHINFQNKELALRDQIFANSLQYLNHTILGDKKGAARKGYELDQLSEKKEINIETVGYSMPLIRYKTTMMSYWLLTNQFKKPMFRTYLEELEAVLETTDPFTRTFILSEVFRALNIGQRFSDIKYLFEKFACYPLSRVVPGQYQLLISLAKKSYRLNGDNFEFDFSNVVEPERISKDFTKKLEQ